MPTAIEPRRTHSIVWPREHGAYGQLAFPLVTAIAAGRPTRTTVLLAAAAVAAFLAHEPLLIVTGQRGRRMTREHAGDARIALAAMGGGALACGLAALAIAEPLVRLAAILPAVLALACAVVAMTGDEKTTGGEVLAAFALSSIALPVALSAGVAPPGALALATVWALASGTHTATVRGVIGRAKSGGSPSLAFVTASLALAVSVGAGVLAWRHSIAPFVVLALVPPAFVSVGLAWMPPAPRSIRRVGWSLMASSALVMTVLIGWLR